MKLANIVAILLASAALAIPAIAGADVLNPPSGPVLDDETADPMPVNNPDLGPPRGQGQLQGQRGQRQRDPQRMANRQQLRRALLAEFDVNKDGRLGPRERVRAVRMLRRLETKLAQPRQGQAQGQQGPRANRDRQQRQFMRRYDVNGDGQVDRNEVPNGAARKLRKFDRNGDGWVDGNEMP